jgi:hypothetical protein
MKFDISTWYETDVSTALELMDSFVNGVEEQAAESAQKFETHKETDVEEYDDSSVLVERYRGLDNQTFTSLKSIFEEYFPSLQRRSAFLTVWAMFENELSKLCERYRNERCSRLAFSDLQGKGIEQSTKYLERVAGLDLHKSRSQEWARIKKMNSLRNVIVHQDGSLRNGSSDQVKSALTYIKETDTLSILDNEIEIKEGFLAHVLETVRIFFRQIGEAIKIEAQNPSSPPLPTTIVKGKT